MTPEQQQLIDGAVRWLETNPRIEALWLAGSLGRGQGDVWSDVDLLALCAPGTFADLARELVAGADTIAPSLLVQPLFGGRVVNMVLEGWQRLDISLIEPADLSRYDAGWLTRLFDRAGAEPTGRYPDSYAATPQSVLPIVNEFLRVLGLAPVVAGRGEYVLLMAGCDQLRRLTIDLMLEENAVPPWARGGALSRMPLLTGAQNESLFALPPLAPTLESALAGHVALAGLFLPRARALAARIGAVWPERFEQGTRDHLRAALGVTI